VLLHFPVVLASEQHNCLDEPKMLCVGPTSYFLPFFVGYSDSGVALAHVPLGEAHLDFWLWRFIPITLVLLVLFVN